MFCYGYYRRAEYDGVAVQNYHVAEVYLGTKVHTSRHDYLTDIIKLAKMAEQVNLTIFREAIKYKRLDNVKRARV